MSFIPDISNFQEASEESAGGFDNNQPSVPTLPSGRNAVLQALKSAAIHLPQAYQEGFANPLISYLERAPDFETSFSGFHDYALAVLQNDTTQLLFNKSVNAFQELVSDIYETFSRVDSDLPPLPPLVKFETTATGVYTKILSEFNKNRTKMLTGVVSLPPVYKDKGILAWSSIAHETGGHDVLKYVPKLEDEARNIVTLALKQAGVPEKTQKMWADWFPEVGADILAVLNIGPAAAIGLIGFFRSIQEGKLFTAPFPGDNHPVDIFRPYLGAEVLELTASSTRAAWASTIRDLARIDLNSNGGLAKGVDGEDYPEAKIIQHTKIIARAVLTTPMKSLRGQTLLQIVNWDDNDERIVANFLDALQNGGTVQVDESLSAGYVISAAVLFAVSANGQTKVHSTFSWMIDVLARMNEANPRWKVATSNL